MMELSLDDPRPVAAESRQVQSAGVSDAGAVAALDLQYQAAVERNDVAAMDAILHPDFTMVLGDGSVVTREELLEEAASGRIVYERQVEDAGTQTVRVWGETAVVTARLWIKGEREGIRLDRTLWFSDTYMRTPAGWKYAFAQASMPHPAPPTRGERSPPP